ncbi:MAG: hypothetical protein R6V35_05635 [Candidatus Nanohaloarchaea archaeon]
MNDSTRREFGKLFGLTAGGAYKATYDYLDSEPTSEIIREDGEVCYRGVNPEIDGETVRFIFSNNDGNKIYSGDVEIVERAYREVCVDDPGKEYNIESIESIDSSWSYQP